MGNKTERISPERQELIVSMYQAGHSRLKCAAQVGTTIDTVNVVLRKHGITEFRPHLSHVFTAPQSQEIARRYESGEKIEDLAVEFGCHRGTIRKELDRHCVVRRDDRGRRRDFTDAEYQQMAELARAGRSQNEIALALNSARDTIQRAMQRAGIPPARIGAARGSRHGGWTGGRFVRPDGYVEVWVDAQSPYRKMAKRNSTVLEHRLVMAQSLGRLLSESESVHHINGNRQDNRLENLQLRQGAHGSGAVYRCLDCGSHNIESVRLK